ncbi:MAG: hypothetical protein HND47_10670 [Chloroflexi bacterium]|nr:hypothetical protein [Chloroflexota bacterium]
MPEPKTSSKPLWQCPICGEKFTTANQWHSCGKFSLKELFSHSEPHVFRIYRKFARMVRACGPVTIIPQKTRVTFQVRMRFVSLYPRKSHLLGGFIFDRRHDHPKFHKVETFSPRNHLHHFRLHSEEDLDSDFAGWIAEAYAVGEQRHLT